jgi:hypothetical protein
MMRLAGAAAPQRLQRAEIAWGAVPQQKSDQ